MSTDKMSAAVPNHRRTKPGGIKTAVVAEGATGATGPTSQIPGLLSHENDDDGLPKKAYNPSNFFGSNGSKNGSKATSPDSQMKAGMQPLAAPFGTDNGSDWEKDNRFSPDKEQMSPDGVADELGGLIVTSKYKKTNYEKKTPPVSMTKLLSHGYIEKKTPNNDDDASSVTSEQTSTTMTEDVEDLE
ncbi:hypothetical protein F7725_009315 [Dissostichus mawsoni]|uniref:Uncharacterized protein n=1 Tax=Dissostichus mawsoni TaxID=36200 RepID=A0A7J5Z720_DISMA|nr:hypothetical protein F7725_009315 [Dissostichus mawsoni]